MQRSSSVGTEVWKAVTGFVRRPGARPLVRFFTRLHSDLYRITKGRAQSTAFPTLVLKVVGRKSGQVRSTPLVYIKDTDDYIVAAAYSGAETNPVWGLNLRDAEKGQVLVGDRLISVTAELVDGADREHLWTQLCEMYPPFLDYETRTTREFPIVRLRPSER